MVQNGKGSVCCESKGQMAPSLSEYFDCSENWLSSSSSSHNSHVMIISAAEEL